MVIAVVGGQCGRGAGLRLEPVAAEVEEAAVGPVARGQEEDEQQDRAVDAGPVEEVGADEEEEDEGRRGVGRDEEEGQPAGGDSGSAAGSLGTRRNMYGSHLTFVGRTCWRCACAER